MASVTIDRHGDTPLFQTWRSDLNDDVVGQMADFIEEKLDHFLHFVGGSENTWTGRKTLGWEMLPPMK